MSVYTDLKEKIRKKKAVITVVGLGYVGLPIALEFCKKGFRVNGLDNNTRRINKLKQGRSYIDDISSSELAGICKKGSFHATTSDRILASSDVVIVCVPTPLRKVKEPDISYIISASCSLAKHIHPGQLIIVESTTYPGTTREVILPELEKSGLKEGKDFYLAFSPERIDPGNPGYGLTNIPKVVGGISKKSTELSSFLYSRIIGKIVKVADTETAEVIKLLENTFRIVNIGLINEFAMLCGKLGINVWEVIKAASTKPFGFMPFYPGPGIGGHCIPADPIYLSWKARKVGFETKMIDLAARINRLMPAYVVKKLAGILKERKKTIRGSRVLIMGVTYKKDINDLRESPALEIIKDLKKRKAVITYHDPHIPYLNLHGISMRSSKLTPAFLKKQDAVVIAADHSCLDYKMIAASAGLIVDTRNVFAREKIRSETIIKL